MPARTITCAVLLLALAAAIAGCGGTHKALDAAAAVREVRAAMGTQARIIDDATGGTAGSRELTLRRAVVDANAGYLALVTANGTLRDLQEHGIEYRYSHGCYGTHRGFRVNPSILWAGGVSEITGVRYTARQSGHTILISSRVGRLIIDPRTHLVRSEFDAGNRVGGIPPGTQTYKYPRSIVELPAPKNLCH